MISLTMCPTAFPLRDCRFGDVEQLCKLFLRVSLFYPLFSDIISEGFTFLHFYLPSLQRIALSFSRRLVWIIADICLKCNGCWQNRANFRVECNSGSGFMRVCGRGTESLASRRIGRNPALLTSYAKKFYNNDIPCNLIRKNVVISYSTMKGEAYADR